MGRVDYGNDIEKSYRIKNCFQGAIDNRGGGIIADYYEKEVKIHSLSIQQQTKP